MEVPVRSLNQCPRHNPNFAQYLRNVSSALARPAARKCKSIVCHSFPFSVPANKARSRPADNPFSEPEQEYRADASTRAGTVRHRGQMTKAGSVGTSRPQPGLRPLSEATPGDFTPRCAVRRFPAAAGPSVAAFRMPERPAKTFVAAAIQKFTAHRLTFHTLRAGTARGPCAIPPRCLHPPCRLRSSPASSITHQPVLCSALHSPLSGLLSAQVRPSQAVESEDEHEDDYPLDDHGLAG